jgi:hypothetical protein
VPVGDGWGYRVALSSDQAADLADTLQTVGSPAKTHVYVALPPGAEMDDLFYYAIQGSVHGFGLLCERVDDHLNEETLAQIKSRIDSAALVIAEVSGADPRVLLQVGYAWGRGCPTILLAKDVQPVLDFYQPIVYGKLRDAEAALLTQLDQMQAAGLLGN